VEHGDRPRPLEDLADRGGALGIDEVVVGVGAGDRDEERRAHAAREPQGQRPDPESVEGVDQGGTV